MPNLEPDKLSAEIKTAGCTVKRTRSGHYEVLDKQGAVIQTFAIKHGRSTKPFVLAKYVSRVRRALKEVREHE